ncbi:MAG: hypothetical protein K8U57_09005 [Planctomycetes bacterium]|nr:hypothetical protein [Planctomycetota bacterium]
MITDDLLQLITAGIDGELTPLESRRLSRLLNSSAEARAIHSKLQADRNKLQALPRIAPPPELQSRVMARIASLTPVPSRLTKLPPRPNTSPKAEPARKSLPFAPKSPRWVPVAIAASLLLCVTTGSFLFFNQKNPQQTVRSTARAPLGNHSGASDPAWAKWLPAESAPRPSAPIGRDLPPVFEHTIVRKDTPVGPAPVVIAIAPTPRAVYDIFTHQPLPETHFETVEVRIPFLKLVADFDREDTREQLAKELNQPTSYRIDLFTRNPVRAVELFREASKAAGVNLLIDANTLTQLQKRTANASVIYTESLTAEEIAALIGKLNAEDAKVSPHVFDMLHALPASPHDASDLKGIFGIDPGLFKRPADKVNEKSERTPDPSKPLSAGTADQIVKSVLSGPTKPGEKPAVLLMWNVAQGRPIPQANSAELKQFLAKRGDRKANAVPVIIVIRPGNG